MKSLSSYCISLIAIVALAVSPARADYHYASHEGSNEYPYTSWETATDSIQNAIDAGSPGDTIYVGSGLWEDGPYDIWDSLALIGMGMDSSIIDGSTFDRFECIFMNHHTLVEGLTFENCIKGIDILTKDGIRIQNNRFRNNYIAIIGVFNGEVTNNIFEDNEELIDCTFNYCSVLIKNNTFTGTTVIGVLTYNGNWTVINNLFHQNPYLSISGLLSIFVPADNDTAYIANNLFYGNLEDVYLITNTIAANYRVGLENNTIIGFDENEYVNGVISASFDEDQPVDFRNNIISGFKRAIWVYSDPTPSAVRLFYNDLWDNEFDSYPGDSLEFVIGNIREAPMFEDSTSFRLQMYSPLIDAGDPDIVDIDGTRSDIGVYGGPLGQSYTYFDLPPGIPDNLGASFDSDSIIITWQYNTEADFNRYQLYRDTVSGFEPSVFNLIAEPETSLYVDHDWSSGHDYYYRISAVDNQDNMSDYSEELAVIFTSINDFDDELLAKVTTIETNYPNPFNNQTRINYYLADVGYQPAMVKLSVYDIGGRLVQRLVDNRQYPGQYTVTWDGLDDNGKELSSGIYFARLVVSGIEMSKPRKIVLIK